MEKTFQLDQITKVDKKYGLMTSILAWCALVVISSMYITIPMLSIFSNVFRVLPSQASWITSAFSFTYGVGFLLFAPLSEKYGRKLMMLAGLIALFVITPIVGLVNQFSVIVILRAIQGLAASTFAPAAFAYIQEMFPIEKRITTIGFLSTGFLMAGIVGQVFSGLVSQILSWSSVFFILGGVYLFSAVLLAGLNPKDEIRQNEESVLAQFKQMGALLFKRNLFFCFFITITLFLSFVGMYTTLGSYLSGSPFELNSNQILVVRATGIIGMLLSPLVGRLTVKFGIRTVMQGGLILATVGIGLMGISPNLPFLVTMSVIFVGGISVILPTIVSLIGNLAGESRGVAVSLYSFILFMGATLGPIVASNLLKTGSYLLTFEILAAILCIGFILSFFIRMNEK